jgi:hypothetical protein
MALGEKMFSATHANLESLPEQSGVFTLYEEGQMIFIGRADGSGHTIRSVVLDHKEGRVGSCTQRFDHYTRETTTNVALRYRELLQRHARKYHRFPKCNDRRRGLVLDRRNGIDRRHIEEPKTPERRDGGQRRSGVERRPST